MVVYWVELAGASNPLSVKICAHQRTSVVANDYAVWILHWDYFENKSVAKKLGVLVLTYQIVDDSIHYPRRI